MKGLSLKQHKMNQSFKKVIGLGLLVFFVMFCFFSFFSSGVTLVISTFNKMFYGDNEEVELDHWELSTVFYDSTVDDGKTPLTEINWDASDGGYEKGETRIITVQINYKNTNTVTSYAPGELKIEVDNLGFNLNSVNDSLLYASEIVVGANDSTHTNYDWNFVAQDINVNNYIYTYEEPTIKLPTFIFSNAKELEKSSNIEGTIQLQYTLYPLECIPRNVHMKNNILDSTDDCDRLLNKSIKASIVGTITSNEILFHYHRYYIHHWEKETYYIKKEAKKISSYDGLPEHSQDYYWVKYVFTITRKHSKSLRSDYPILDVNNFRIKDFFSDNIIVLDKSLNHMTASEDGYYYNEKTWNSMWQYDNNSKDNTATIYVGYPKNFYNVENNNLNIINSVDLVGEYEGRNGEELLAQDEVSINLLDFDFSYTGDLYQIQKKVIGNSTKSFPESGYKTAGTLYYQSLIGEDNELGSAGTFKNVLKVSAKYVGKTMDIRFGDDLLYISDMSGGLRKLQEDEYYFSQISFPAMLYNGNGIMIGEDKYNCELWIKKFGNTNYIKYADFKNTAKQQYSTPTKIWNFNQEDKVISYYFIIKDATESIITNSQINTGYYASNPASSIIKINNAKNIPESGFIYNFAYTQVYIDDELQNEMSYEDYSDFILQNEISQFDIDNYGKYLQRDADYIKYEKYFIPSLNNRLSINKTLTPFVQDAVEEKFFGTATLDIGTYHTTIADTTESNLLKYYRGIDSETFIKGYELYDLLPKGMILDSSEDEIKNSITIDTKFSSNYRILDGNGHIFTKDEWILFVKEKATIKIDQNYHNLDRMKISIIFDFSERPIIVYRNKQTDWANLNVIKLQYKYFVTYDSYFENGQTYKNHAYLKYHNNKVESPNFLISSISNSSVKDNGINDLQELDIDNNGDSTETIAFKSSSQTITSVISSHQDVQVSVHANNNDFDIGKVNTDLVSDYFYKLRVRTGTNDVTNLVIYDSLEKYSKDSNMEFISSSNGKKFWNGEFLGIDTSYAESKGYIVKVYYSENETPGSLKEDDSWVLYTDSVDKSKVKSLAFEYLDSSGNPAVLPANSLTYVLIKMKSPSDESLKTLSYNGCWTEWNAIDSITGNIVDFVTGINSNIVKVALPDSVEPVDIDYSIDKYWNDYNNENRVRPDSIKIKVVPNNDFTKAIEVSLGSGDVDSNDSNHWFTSVSIPKYDDDGNIIQYSLWEDSIELDNYIYIPEIDKQTVTNTLYKNITLTKKWLDNHNSYLTRPSNITVKVLQNNSDYKEVSLTGDYVSDWVKDIRLPLYDSNHNKYHYTFKEIDVSNYESQFDTNTYTFTNTLKGDQTIHIQKKWIDSSNMYHTRPENITIHLLQNGNFYQDVVLTGNEDIWKKDIEVPKYDSNGILYSYTILEDNLSSYGLVEYNQNSYMVSNTLMENMEITITKKWVDSSNQYGTRPSELKVKLLRNNENYQELVLHGNEDIWSISVEVPKYDENQKLYQYTIQEENQDLLLEYSDVLYDNYNITNRLKKNMDITIYKVWDDDHNKYNTRPEEVDISIYQNDIFFQDIKLSGEGDQWSSVLKDIPVYDENGVKYHYSILEKNPNDRYGNITYDQTNFTVTNQLTERPTVTLYFTVQNGYTLDGKEIKFDDNGLKTIMDNYNLDYEKEYVYQFELKNEDTGKIYEGSLSTRGILQFEDIPYGTYRAVEQKDQFFDFVHMLSIEDIPGVSFKQDDRGGIIIISPTGNDIIYGANIVNKIQLFMNPETSSSLFVILVILFSIIGLFTYSYIRRKV